MEGSFHIHVHDLCLDVGTKLTADVHVSSVYSIDVQVADKVWWDGVLRSIVLGHKWSLW